MIRQSRRARRSRSLLATLLVVLLALAAACSDGEPSAGGDDAPELTLPSTTTTAPGATTGPTTTFLPNTDVVSGEEAVLTGEVSMEQVAAPELNTTVGCHYVTTDEGTKVSTSFSDVYEYGGVEYPGPPEYVGDPEDYENDPLLVHPGDRIIVRGEVVEVEDPCTASTAFPGLTVLVETYAPS